MSISASSCFKFFSWPMRSWGAKSAPKIPIFRVSEFLAKNPPPKGIPFTSANRAWITLTEGKKGHFDPNRAEPLDKKVMEFFEKARKIYKAPALGDMGFELRDALKKLFDEITSLSENMPGFTCRVLEIALKEAEQALKNPSTLQPETGLLIQFLQTRITKLSNQKQSPSLIKNSERSFSMPLWKKVAIFSLCAFCLFGLVPPGSGRSIRNTIVSPGESLLSPIVEGIPALLDFGQKAIWGSPVLKETELFLEEGNCKKAFESALKSSFASRDPSLSKVATSPHCLGKHSKIAIKAAGSISGSYSKDAALKEQTEFFLVQGKCKKAFKRASETSLTSSHDFSLSKVATSPHCLSKYPKTAAKAAASIWNSYSKETALKDQAEFYLKEENYKKAFEIASESSFTSRDDLLKKIATSENCLEKHPEIAKQAVAKIRSSYLKHDALEKQENFFRKLAKKRILEKRHIRFGTTYVKGNSERDELSRMIDENHREYAKAWKLEHRVVTDNLLKDQCTYPEDLAPKISYGQALGVKFDPHVDCVPYWNKVAVLRNWLQKPAVDPDREEWYILTDDDMPVTNMKVNPYKAIDQLRRGKDTSVIVARDVQLWKNGDRQLSVNTGLLFVRKDEQSKKLIEDLWNKRDTPTGSKNEVCPTLGTCKNQDVLHEQEGLAQVIQDDRSLLDRVITVVDPRDDYESESDETQEIAINTFNREGCFRRKQENWAVSSFNYNADSSYPAGKWRAGDWMGQTAGVPTFGWWCNDYNNGLPPGPVRKDLLQQMIDKVVR